MELNTFKTDKTLEEQGTWIDLSPTSKIKLARIGCKNFQQEVKKRQKPYRAMVRAGTLPDHVQTQILVGVLAETIILGWEGFTEGGEPVPYTKDNAVRVLTESRDFRDFIVTLADDINVFKAAEREDGLKNS